MFRRLPSLVAPRFAVAAAAGTVVSSARSITYAQAQRGEKVSYVVWRSEPTGAMSRAGEEHDHEGDAKFAMDELRRRYPDSTFSIRKADDLPAPEMVSVSGMAPPKTMPDAHVENKNHTMQKSTQQMEADARAIAQDFGKKL